MGVTSDLSPESVGDLNWPSWHVDGEGGHHSQNDRDVQCICDQSLAIPYQTGCKSADLALLVRVLLVMKCHGADVQRHRIQVGATMLAGDQPLALKPIRDSEDSFSVFASPPLQTSNFACKPQCFDLKPQMPDS